MARTFIRQDTQIYQSDVYDDTFTMANAESSATNVEDDLNYIRTQLKVLSGGTNWYDALSDTFNLTAIHDKTFVYWVQKTDDVAVPASQNYVLLTGSTKPSGNIAIGSTALGTIVAQLGTAVGSHSTTAATNNGNLLEIRDAATNDPIYTGAGDQIFGLLQVGTDATDGNAFGDTGNDQAQISFVYFDPSTEAITAVSVADIESTTVEYAYRTRTDFYNLPENAFDQSVTFVDGVATDLQGVYDNDANGSFALSSAKNYTVDLNSNADFEITDGGSSFLLADQSAGEMIFNVDISLLNGETLKFYDSGSSNFISFVAPALTADTAYTWPAADATAADQVLTSDSSGGLTWTSKTSQTKKATRIVTGSDINADTAINISTFTNTDSMTFGSSATNWVEDYEVYVNGVLQLNGASAATNNDVYWLSSATIAFEYKIKVNDVIQIIQRRAR